MLCLESYSGVVMWTQSRVSSDYLLDLKDSAWVSMYRITWSEEVIFFCWDVKSRNIEQMMIGILIAKTHWVCSSLSVMTECHQEAENERATVLDMSSPGFLFQSRLPQEPWSVFLILLDFGFFFWKTMLLHLNGFLHSLFRMVKVRSH